MYSMGDDDGWKLGNVKFTLTNNSIHILLLDSESLFADEKQPDEIFMIS